MSYFFYLEIAFWALLGLVFYAYLGYGILLYILILVKRLFKGQPKLPNMIESELPTVTLLVAAYNEEDYIENKIRNSLDLDYPEEKLSFLFVTDGSDDSTPDIVRKYPVIKLMHKPERMGKIAAVDRSMTEIDSEIVVFSDANTELNQAAIKNIVRHYQHQDVGAVAGEKRIKSKDSDQAAGAGEGIYWRYESTLKRWDSELYSVVGAAGELFSIRRDLFEKVPPDSIIEDFFMTLRIAKNGKRVIYEPDAYAVETSSASSGEELKRKIRIAAGGLQSIIRLGALLNFFKYGILSFQYISHRVLRWTLAPLALPVIFGVNAFLALENRFYTILFVLQSIFYIFALIGWYFESKQIKIKVLFIPFYFTMMNYAVFVGWKRYARGSQKVTWEKAKRAA